MSSSCELVSFFLQYFQRYIYTRPLHTPTLPPQYQDEAQQWYKRAELALSKGDEELAREALKRKKTAEDVAQGYRVQVDNIKVSVDQLLANTRAMEAKVAEAKAKKDTLKARAASAKTSKQIQELVQGIDTKSALGAFDRMEQKVLGLEAETQAIAELAAPEQVRGEEQGFTFLYGVFRNHLECEDGIKLTRS